MTSIEFWSLAMDSLSTILAAAAIFLYIIFWYKDKTSNDYDVFDNLYLDLLKTGMEHPKFRDISKTVNYKTEFSEDELIQYEIYAFITWNFIETILDKGDENLHITWLPAVKYEAALHIEWFKQPENQVKYKELFKKQVQEFLD
jgi:hypothetical protein